MPDDLSRLSVIDMIEWLLRGLMAAMERELKQALIALMEPLMDLTLALNPLPHYKLSVDIMDGHQPMR